MQQSSTTRPVELVTAILLGVISLATALLALQGTAWTMRADAFERDASNARDVSVTQSVLAEYSRATDAEASAAARLVWEDYLAETDDLVKLQLYTQWHSELGLASPTFSDAWVTWAEQGFPDDSPALENEDYVAYRDGLAQSYAHVATIAADLEDEFKHRSLILAQASLVNALALFLVGISGINRSSSVRIAVLSIGTTVFLSASAIAAGAF